MSIRAVTGSTYELVKTSPQRTAKPAASERAPESAPHQPKAVDSQQGRAMAQQLYRQTIYDQPLDARTSTAINTYHSYATMNRREEIQAMLHLDVYA